MDDDEFGEGVKGFEGAVWGGGWVVEEGVKLDAEEGDFRGEVFDCQGVFQLVHLVGVKYLE